MFSRAMTLGSATCGTRLSMHGKLLMYFFIIIIIIGITFLIRLFTVCTVVEAELQTSPVEFYVCVLNLILVS